MLINRFRGFVTERAWLLVVVSAYCATNACAYPPLIMSPSIVNAQADLVVVGRLKEGSVKYVPEKKNDYLDFRPQATLIIDRVERGKLTSKEIVIWFRGTSAPVVGGRLKWDFGDGVRDIVDAPTRDKASIHVYAINSSTYKMCRSDLRENHVWFLKSGSDVPGTDADVKAWCLGDAQFVVPLESKGKYLNAPTEGIGEWDLD